MKITGCCHFYRQFAQCKVSPAVEAASSAASKMFQVENARRTIA